MAGKIWPLKSSSQPIANQQHKPAKSFQAAKRLSGTSEPTEESDLAGRAKRPSAGEHLEIPKGPAIFQRFRRIAPASAHFALASSFSRPDFVPSFDTNML
jgi:hypothetical protein